MPSPAASRALRLAGHVARLALGAIFVAAGVLKSLDVAEFARQTAGYGLISPGLATIAAPFLIALETTLGTALLAGFRPRLTALLTGMLLIFFITLEAWGMSKGHTESCGCFGAYVQRTPAQVIMEDTGFLALAVLAMAGLGAWQARRAGRAAALVAATAVFSLGFAFASPRLPIDPWVTKLRAGRTVQDLGIAARLPHEGSQGTLVALLDVTRPESKEAAAGLSALADAASGVKVIALTPSSDQEQAAFLWEVSPAFDVVPVDRGLLKPLYRRLPVYFLVREGRVARVFPGPRPPAPDLLSSAAL
jgi:putative oxidoreductase